MTSHRKNLCIVKRRVPPMQPVRDRIPHFYPDLPEDRDIGIRRVQLQGIDHPVTQWVCDTCSNWTFELWKREQPIRIEMLVECETCSELTLTKEHENIVVLFRNNPERVPQVWQNPEQVPPPLHNFLTACRISRKCSSGRYLKYRRQTQ